MTIAMNTNAAAWAEGIKDPKQFAREQDQLAQVWTLLGLTTDIPNDNDWFRARLGGREVFVQRFGDTIKAFENVCVHRFFPLRTEDKGNGVIRCGFHHWQYNKDGRAVGIPHCQDLFGMTPRELDARLNPVEIETCGMGIFGRFAAPDATETLEQYLGDMYPILKTTFGTTRAPYLRQVKVAANWKMLYHVTLDDYHIVAVHPDTFGKEGYLKQDVVRYFRAGKHSAYFYNPVDYDLAQTAELCRNGTFQPHRYRIFQLFPNLVVVHLKTALSWYILVQQYVPLAHDHTLVRTWFYLAPFPIEDKSWLHRLFRKYIELWLPPFVWYYIRKITGEDHAVCEKQQAIAAQIDAPPIIGAQEERIAWFEEAYEQAMRASPTPPPPMAGGLADKSGRVTLAFAPSKE